ncbi:MAG: ABC transporter ATP-binding protein [Xanthobacteraceae bacterium]|nr:ABC transporter ATP-binding protein [Xanthobacteraceae bacterium]
MNADPVLSTRGLTKRFGTVVVADNIDFDLHAGERAALIGPNGAGKTSFVGLVSGTIRPDAGGVHLNGQDVTRLRSDHRVKAGLVRTFQITNLFNKLTVRQNLYLPVSERIGASNDIWSPAAGETAIIDEIDDILVRLGLIEDRHRTITELPYGRRRLLEIGIALSLRPKVLILDEPAAGLRAEDVILVLDVIGRLPAEMAMMMIEHDMQVVKRFASRVTVLVRGAVLMTGSPSEVMSADAVRAVYLGRAGHTRFHDSAHA